MITKISWLSFKSIITANPGTPYFWRIENKLSSNDPGIQDYTRYWIRISIGVIPYEAFVDIALVGETKGADQVDFEDNYKAGGIEA